MAHENTKGLVAFGVAFLVFLTVIRTPAWRTAVAPQETIHGIAVALFDTYMVPFLVLSVLLTGALFGALYMATRSPDESEEGAS